MKECDKRKSHTSSKLHMIYISSDNVKTACYQNLHYTSVVFTILPHKSFQAHILGYITIQSRHSKKTSYKNKSVNAI
jgi:hypothetical protein